MNCKVTTAAISVAALLAVCASAFAQEAEQIAANELPPVVIEGATIEAKPVAKPKAKPAPVVAEEPEPAPQPVAKKKKSVAKASTPKKAGAPATAAPAEEFPEPVAPSSSTDVTATPVSEGSEVAGIPAEKVGSSVSVVTAEQLKNQQVRTAAEALRSLPGVSVSQQGGSQNLTVVRLRGAESNHTLVLVDGVEVNAAGTDGFFDFSTMLVDDIAQIEVIRGPQSGLYSSGALGGVINIVTRGGKGPLTFRARAEGGSFDTRDGMVGISGGTDRAHMSLSLSGRRTNGFDISSKGTEDDGGQFSTLSFTGGVMIFDNLKLDATLRRAHREGDRDGTSDVLNGLFVASEERSTFASDVWLGRVAATLDTFDSAWVHKVFVSGVETDNSDLDRGAFSPPDGTRSRNISTTSQIWVLIDVSPGWAIGHACPSFSDRSDRTSARTV